MKIIIIVLILAFLPFGILKSQSEKNIWLEKVDPKLLEKVDLNKIPNAPNKLNSKGNRNGEWVIWLSKSHDETSNPDFVYLYRKLKYNDGVVIGKVEDYYLDGTLSATGEIKSDKFDNEVIYYNTDGKKQKIETYKNGKLNGSWIKFADNEKVTVKGAFKDGKRTGKWEGFYENGTKKFSGKYTKGLKNYTWTYWDDNNKIKNMKLYIEDVEVSPKEAVIKIDNMIINNEIEEATSVNRYYKELITWKKGEESKEFLDGLYLDSKIYISQKNDANAIEVLNILIDNENVSVETYHGSLINLSKLYKKTSQFEKSKEVLNKALAKLEAGELVLPFEKNIVIDELANIYLKQEDYNNLDLIIQKANIDKITKVLKAPNGFINYLKDNLNDDKFRKTNILDNNKVYIIDTRITELVYKDIILSETKQIEKNQLINKVVLLYNIYSSLKNLDSFVKQYNPQNRMVLIDKNILESLIKKYDIRFK